MKIAILVLSIVLIGLQIKLWFGDGGVHDMWQLQEAIADQTEENRQLAQRNQALTAEVQDLKQGLEAIEERARSELGMIKEGEIFYQVIENRTEDDNTGLRFQD